VYIATGRLNKEEQTYKLEDDDLWLNASAEHTLAPMYMNETLKKLMICRCAMLATLLLSAARPELTARIQKGILPPAPVR
jgi:hypothetical protein